MTQLFMNKIWVETLVVLHPPHNYGTDKMDDEIYFVFAVNRIRRKMYLGGYEHNSNII